jgi:hypothetical protein
MASYDQSEIEAINVVRLKAQRARLRRSKQVLKEGVAVVTPSLRKQLDDLDAQVRDISNRIFQLTGERE